MLDRLDDTLLRLDDGELVTHLAQDRGHRHIEGVADGPQQLGGRLLLPTLDLGEVTQRDLRAGRDLAQGAVLGTSPLAQHVANQSAQQDHDRTPSSLVRPPYSERGTDGRTRTS